MWGDPACILGEARHACILGEARHGLGALPPHAPLSPVLHGVLPPVRRVPDGYLHAVVPQLPLLKGIPLGIPVI